MILVTGGTGHLGNIVVNRLLQDGHEVGLLTTRHGITPVKGATMYYGNLETGEGLKDATQNMEVIIHCASNPERFEQTDIKGTRNLLSVIDPEVCRHIMYISIVGVDISSFPYYMAKHAAERMIMNGPVPYSILRSSQFHNFVLGIIGSLEKEGQDGILTIPDALKFQPVDVREVGTKLVESIKLPSGLMANFCGPEVLTFDEMILQYMEVTGKSLEVRNGTSHNAMFDEFRSGINLCGTAGIGKLTWMEFLKEMYL